MVLTEEEKEAFLQKIADLIDAGVIDKDVMRHFYSMMLVACERKICERNKGAKHEK